MPRRFLVLLFALSAMTFSSCENEIEVLGPYEENMIVYGLLNIGESTQYIRVNKVYINPDNSAMEIAKISDSLFYDSLVVQLKNEKTSQTYDLVKETGVAKDSGFFANDLNILYRYDGAIDPLATYSLLIRNPESGKTVSGSTSIVGTTIVQSPFKDSTVAFNIQVNKNIFFQFTPGKNAKIVDVQATIYYEEISDADTTQRSTKTLSWKIISGLTTNNSAGSQQFNIPVPGDYFFQTIASSIAVKDGIHRKLLKCDLHFYAGSEDLFTYMSINKPSLGIVQKKPEYSNVNGSLGLFSSRNTVSIKGIKFSAETKQRLSSYPDAFKLKFYPN